MHVLFIILALLLGQIGHGGPSAGSGQHMHHHCDSEGVGCGG